MKHRLFIVVLFAAMHTVASAQNALSDSLTRFVQHKGDSLHKANSLPGLFIGVLNDDKRHYFNFGYAIPDNKLPFAPDFMFEAGSITKTFTAFIVTSVLQEARISETASILPYLPDSVQRNKALANITFLSLLNHTSGLPRLPDNMPIDNGDQQPYKNYTEARLFTYLKTAEPKPDGKSNYSNLGMGLAGVLASRLTKKSFDDLVRHYFVERFKVWVPQHPDTVVQSQGYFGVVQTPYWNMAALTPAGGLQCSTNEMLSYLQFISSPTSRKAQAIVDTLLSPTARLSPAVSIGRGWHTLERKDKPIIYWHNGGTYGFSTFAAFIKGTKQAVIVVANRFNANNVTDALGMAIMRRLAP